MHYFKTLLNVFQCLILVVWYTVSSIFNPLVEYALLLEYYRKILYFGNKILMSYLPIWKLGYPNPDAETAYHDILTCMSV